MSCPNPACIEIVGRIKAIEKSSRLLAKAQRDPASLTTTERAAHQQLLARPTHAADEAALEALLGQTCGNEGCTVAELIRSSRS